MRRSGGSSWQIRTGSDLFVHTALYLRDALALPFEPMIPPLAPPVPVGTPDGVHAGAVAAQWPDWWLEVLAEVTAESADPVQRFRAHPGWAARPDRAALGAAVQAVSGDASRHRSALETWERQRRRLPLGDLVREREARLGRTARPFRLVITELGVQGHFARRLATDHLLVSSALLQDPERWTALVEPVLDDLV
jgi:hypothetical protein